MTLPDYDWTSHGIDDTTDPQNEACSKAKRRKPGLRRDKSAVHVKVSFFVDTIDFACAGESGGEVRAFRLDAELCCLLHVCDESTGVFKTN